MADPTALEGLVREFPVTSVYRIPSGLVRCFFDGEQGVGSVSVDVDLERRTYQLDFFALFGPNRASLRATITLLGLVHSFVERLDASGYRSLGAV